MGPDGFGVKMQPTAAFQVDKNIDTKLISSRYLYSRVVRIIQMCFNILIVCSTVVVFDDLRNLKFP